jgi:hypothetical protein
MSLVAGRAAAAVLVVAVAARAAAQEASAETTAPPATQLPEVVVRGRAEDLLGTAHSASQGAIGAVDLEDMPLLRRGELMETVPGMVVTQHSGDGKANQYFLRGFNLDHGTDFAFSVDGVPVNLPTHAHGQGYSDLNFMVPELVDFIEYKKGPFYAEVGDFSGAGAADIHVVNRLAQSIALAQVGLFGFVRALVADSPEVGPGNLLYALEYNHYDGPWDLAEHSSRVNGFLRYHWGDGADRFVVSASVYAAPGWHSTDQVARRAVDGGMIGRFGALDTSDGGNTGRGTLGFDWTHDTGDAATKLMLYGFYYRLNLYSNFTYFLDDPVNGDQFEQIDERFVAGGHLRRIWHQKWWGMDADTTVGIQLRNDIIPTVGLNHTRAREVVRVDSKDRVEEFGGGVYAQNQIQWTSWFKTIVGLRADVVAIDVDSDTAANSGSAAAAIVNPKAVLVFGPWDKTELYLDVGTGFHSNDARGVTITVSPDPANPVPHGQVPLLVHTVGAEAGVRTSIVPGLVSTLSLWYLHSDSELTFAGDSGDTEANPPSEKYGLEWASFYKPTSWLTLSADLSLTHARYVDNPDGNYIANSIPVVVSAAATAEAPFGLYASARLRYFSRQPLIEDDSVTQPSSTLVDAKIGYRHAWWEGAVEILNLFDAKTDDIAYYYASRVGGEPAGVNDVHVHPAEPLQVRVSLTAHY